MIGKLLTNKNSAEEILSQLRSCKSFWFAVAWATESPIFDEIYKFRQKINCAVIGTHGYITSPHCLEIIGNEKGVSIKSAKGKLFHPKIYLFEHDGYYYSIIGSHNLTNGAFFNNEEISFLSRINKDSLVIKEIISFIDSASKTNSITPTKAFLIGYKDKYNAIKRMRKSMENFYEEKKEDNDLKEEERRTHAPVYITWSVFLEKIEEKEVGAKNRRLMTLDGIRELLERPGGFLSLTPLERKRIGGLSMERVINGVDIDWNYFGEMNTLARFNKPYALLMDKSNPHEISNAINLIPSYSEGNPTREDWNRFWQMVSSFSEGSIGISAATRLAAVKRPDYFVPVTNANKSNLSKILDINKNLLDNGENYWDVVIENITMTPWWSSEAPEDEIERKIWNARAAMLDALVYERDSTKR